MLSLSELGDGLPNMPPSNGGSPLNGASMRLRWDPKNLEIKTLSVEKTLEPLVMQVTTLVNTKGPSKKVGGRSKRAHVLVAAVERATQNFIISGEEIAVENSDIADEMLLAVAEVRDAGAAMSESARHFAEEPCSSMKRAAMVRAARGLLSAVTRLLILADMVDVHRLLRSLRAVEDDLERVRTATSQAELVEFFRNLGSNTSLLIQQVGEEWKWQVGNTFRKTWHHDDVIVVISSNSSFQRLQHTDNDLETRTWTSFVCEATVLLATLLAPSFLYYTHLFTFVGYICYSDKPKKLDPFLRDLVVVCLAYILFTILHYSLLR